MYVPHTQFTLAQCVGFKYMVNICYIYICRLAKFMLIKTTCVINIYIYIF